MRIPLVLLAVAMVLTGCASSPTAEPAPQALAARERVAELASDLSQQNRDDINFVARAATEIIPADLTMIGITSTPAASLGDVFGSLQFLSPAVTDTTVYPAEELGPFCFSVDFTFYGATDTLSGWDGPEGIATIDCPDDAAAVTPPIDETVYPVIAANAFEAASSVLASLGSTLPSEESVAASIAALLEAPEGEFSTAAPPSVEIKDGEVGVAMGDENDCVLLRLADGVVEQLYAAPVLLQPGELGCQGSTALYPDLSSPH
ncbi:hypothetical protein EYE40_07215 [Glaciihabitans arcticus]|uniref:Lipoprotein n=1 Tax=Glaciihabitans arcticus TaxID=2668039 RepID=A0A4Q9GST6_9MICO|nr:hypothetical protein [Glaciihabitans arcticus]TBN57204.1 hypothetical protein EYE40_07215 [Glaciihabitans arcticus]